MKTRSRHVDVRRRIAAEAARLLANSEAADFPAARRKAAARLRSKDRRDLPENHEIHAALRDYQKLFSGLRQEAILRSLRSEAVKAMRSLHAFKPRLTGAVLDGTADACTPIRLLLFADTTEELQIRLMDLRIPATQRVVTIRHADGETLAHDCFDLRAGEVVFELILLPPGAHSNPPLDPVSEKPSLGASLAQVERLLHSAD